MVDSVYKGLFRGAAWTVAMRWMLRLIGLVNLIILARLLTPSDLGLVAMAALLSSFASNFTEMGAQQLLIRQRDITRDDINSAWTIHVMQGLLVSALMILAAPYAATYFGDPRVESIVRVLALVPLIRGFGNIGLTLARRDLQFSIDFRARVYGRLAEFFITLGLVLWLRSFWALVIGSVLGSVVAVLVGYRMHPYRAVVCHRRLGPYMRFATSFIPLRIARFGNNRAGVIVGAGIATSAQFGVFNLAFDLTALLGRELVAPLSRGLFPGYSRLNSDRTVLARVFVEMLGAATLLLLPAGVGLALLADDFVSTVLGSRWLGATKYIQVFALAGALAGINYMMNFHILIAAGHEARAALAAWFRLILYVPVVVAAGWLGGDLLAIARVSFYFEILFLPVSILVLKYSVPVSLAQLAGGLIRPLMATVLMALFVVGLSELATTSAALRLALGVCLGAIVYVLALYLLWRVFGRPLGAEALLLDYLQRRMRIIRGSLATMPERYGKERI
jgi:O-antigen/teichoic acid export membrane protein